jgi:hypothetical protein
MSRPSIYEAFRMFYLQVINYGLIALSYRILAVGILWQAVALDGIYAVLAFTIIRNIAKADPTNPLARVGYVLGSMLGTGVGLVVSKLITGGR